MSAIQRVTTPDRYLWKCGEKWCHCTISTTDEKETATLRERHIAMHVMAKKGTKVKVVSSATAHMHDTGRITNAYVDQNRFHVLLDRKGKCDACGGATPIYAQLRFDDLALVDHD